MSADDAGGAVRLAARVLEDAVPLVARGVGGHEAIRIASGALAAELASESLAVHARLLAVGAYFDSRGDGVSVAEDRLALAARTLRAVRVGGDRSYQPIGWVRSPFTKLDGMPLQTVAAQGIKARIEIDPAYAAGLCDLDGFSHLWLLTDLDRATGFTLEVVPFLDDTPRGLFATRSPRRPNPIALSLVRLVGVGDSTLDIEEIDLLDNTPVLDIKPYVPLFDERRDVRIGWFRAAAERVHSVRSDERYSSDDQ